jgi:hypothetical protein
VQLGEALHEGSLERAALPLAYDERVRALVLVVVALAAAGDANAAVPTPDAAMELPLLRYGRSWTWHGIRCTSRRTGLNCKNQSGHGFVFSRQSQHVF